VQPEPAATVVAGRNCCGHVQPAATALVGLLLGFFCSARPKEMWSWI